MVSSSWIRSAETVATSGAASVIAARSARRHGVFEPGGKLRRAQHAQRIFAERGGCQDVDPPGADIGLAIVGIDELGRGQRPGQHVHPEVPPSKVLGDRDVRPAGNLEVAMAAAKRALAAGQGDVDGLAVDGELDHRKRGADEIDPAQRAQPVHQLLEWDAGHNVIGVDGERVDPLGLGADLVADSSAYGEERAGRQRRSEAFVEGGRAVHRTHPIAPHVPRGTLLQMFHGEHLIDAGGSELKRPA